MTANNDDGTTPRQRGRPRTSSRQNQGESGMERIELEYNIPMPLVFKLATPWILYKGRLFSPSDKAEVNVSNYLNIQDIRFPLIEIESPKGLEELYYKKNSEDIEVIKRMYAERAINSEYHSKKAIEEELAQNKVLQLLITKILPVITNYNSDDQISRMIDEEKGIAHQGNFIDVMAGRGAIANNNTQNLEEITERELELHKQQMIKDIEKQYRRFEVRNNGGDRLLNNPVIEQLVSSINNITEIPKLYDQSILNTHIFPDRKLMFYNNAIYDLVSPAIWISYFQGHIDGQFLARIKRMSANQSPEEYYQVITQNLEAVEKTYLSRLTNKLLTSHIKIDDQYYFPILIEEENFNDTVKHYKKLIEKEIKIKAVEHNAFQTAQMADIAKQRAQLSKIANLEKFDLNGAGYEKKDSKYYVYIKTEPFVLKSPHVTDPDCYLPFPSAKIGVGINYDTYSRKFTLDTPIIMNRYRHPFLPGDASMQQICLGRYSASTAMYKPPEEAILELLSKSKENILTGYKTGENPYPGNKLNKSKWSGWITKTEADRRELPCLNDYRG